MKRANSYRDLDTYQAAFHAQQQIFTVSQAWPRIENRSLIDQIRRSSRSVGANLAEAWAKRRYPAHFVSKLSDADAELQETLHWLETAMECGYVEEPDYDPMRRDLMHIGRKLGAMMKRPETFCF
jgi:four helix bundle protein